MSSRLRYLLFVPLFLLSFSAVKAQDYDYLKHSKIFNLCSFKRQCSQCYTCDQERYIVKIKNNVDKKITGVSYKFYSEVFNKVLTKEAKVEGKRIDNNQIGLLYICIPRGESTHWIISEIEYADGSKNSFTLKDRLGNFIQEPDECDCND